MSTMRPEFSAQQLAEVRRLQSLYPDRRGALLPVLHMAQDTFGHVSLPMEEYVASLFELSPAHVHEVVTFYTLYFQAPKGEAYFATEGANGELGFYVVSDGSDRPYRVRCRPPCLPPMAALHRMIEGGMIADVVPTFGSVNMIGGELDR